MPTKAGYSECVVGGELRHAKVAAPDSFAVGNAEAGMMANVIMVLDCLYSQGTGASNESHHDLGSHLGPYSNFLERDLLSQGLLSWDGGGA